MPTVSAPTRERSLVDHLRRQLARPAESQARNVWSTGLEPLDELLADGGVRSGSIIEWLADAGSGASTLIWLMARHLQQPLRSIVVIDAEREFFPPGVAGLGVDPSRVVVVHPRSQTEALWALEQSLRSEAGCVVISRLARLPQQTYRRLKLAAEQGGGMGLFLRPLRYRTDRSWADVRVLVESRASQEEDDAPFAAHLKCAAKRPPDRTIHFTRRIGLQLLHVRGGGFQQRQTLMSIDDDARVVPVDSELAGAAAPDAAARAS